MIVEEKPVQTNAINLLFEDLYETERKLSPTQIWNAEINLYQNLPRAEGASDPLEWWKAHSGQLPILGMKIYIFIFCCCCSFFLDLFLIALSFFFSFTKFISETS
jgi:hypothetical protein